MIRCRIAILCWIQSRTILAWMRTRVWRSGRNVVNWSKEWRVSMWFRRQSHTELFWVHALRKGKRILSRIIMWKCKKGDVRWIRYGIFFFVFFSDFLSLFFVSFSSSLSEGYFFVFCSGLYLKYRLFLVF